MKSKAALTIATMLAFGGDLLVNGPPPAKKKAAKPKFTDDELSRVRACATKSERKRVMAELRKKYAS